MKTKILSCLPTIFCLLAGGATPAFAQGTAFSYEGRLNTNGTPTQGIYDFRSAIYNAVTNGTQIGGTLTNSATGVTNGLFNLALDFGPGIFTGPARWLEIGVRTNGGVFTNMTPRTALLAAPYAIYAATASGVSSNAVTGVSIQDATITAIKVAPGQVVKSLNGLTDNVTLSSGANVSLTTNGSTIQISSSGSGAFSLNGNNTYYNLGNVGIGTTTPSAYGHGGTAKILEVNNSGTTLNSQAHLMLFSGVNSLVNSAIGTVTWAQPGGMAAYIGATTRSSTPNVPTAKLTFGTRNIGDGAAVARMTIMEDGKVGIGTTSPAYLLDVNGTGSFNSGVQGFSYPGDGVFGETTDGSGVDAVSLGDGEGLYASSVSGWAGYFQGNVYVTGNPNITGYAAITGTDTVNDGVYGFSSGANGVHGVTSAITQAGVAGVNTVGGYGVAGFSDAASGTGAYGRGAANGVYGTSSSGTGVDGESTSGVGVFGRSQNNNGVFGLASGNAQSGVLGASSSATGYGGYFYNSGGGVALHVNGSAEVLCLTILGGCDVAEPFQMSDKVIPQGSVVVIDAQNAGKLKLSDEAYDTRVAGIVSGANGINPGVSLHQEGVMQGGQNVALSGRVYVLADASGSAIKPGDLLTTSTTPGHAMKVADHAKGQGAIIGKAMSSLKEGRGMVLVLVTLQ